MMLRMMRVSVVGYTLRYCCACGNRFCYQYCYLHEHSFSIICTLVTGTPTNSIIVIGAMIDAAWCMVVSIITIAENHHQCYFDSVLSNVWAEDYASQPLETLVAPKSVLSVSSKNLKSLRCLVPVHLIIEKITYTYDVLYNVILYL